MSDLVKEYAYRYDARPNHDLELPSEVEYSREKDVAAVKGIRREHDQVFIKQLMDRHEVAVSPDNEIYVIPKRNKLFLDFLRRGDIYMDYRDLPDDVKELLQKNGCICDNVVSIKFAWRG